MTTVNPQYTDRVLAVRGLNVYTRRRAGASSPPLLLINGLGGSLTSWAPLLEQLHDRDVVMIDTPGSGQSQTPPLPIRVRALADIFAAATRALGVEQVDVLGYSLGGVIAQELARRHPTLVRRLVLVGTMHGLGAQPVPLRVCRTLLSTKRYRDPAAMARDLPRLAGGRTARDATALAALARVRESHPPSPRGYYYQQLSMIGWSSWFWLKKLGCPALVVHGSGDPVVPIVNARMLASRIPEARLEIVEDAGHLLLFDEADKVAPILDAFLGQ